MVKFLWITPMPPCWAKAIARDASVTVSMADEQSGMLSSMPRENRVRMSTSPGKTSEYAGTRRTSSKVRPSFISFRSISLGERNYTKKPARIRQAVWSRFVFRLASDSLQCDVKYRLIRARPRHRSARRRNSRCRPRTICWLTVRRGRCHRRCRPRRCGRSGRDRRW